MLQNVAFSKLRRYAEINTYGRDEKNTKTMVFKRKKKTLDRIWLISKELYLFLGLNFGFILVQLFGGARLSNKSMLVIEGIIIAMGVLAIYIKSNRIVDSIDFDEQNKTLTIKYYQWFTLHSIESRISTIKYNYRLKIYGGWSVMKVLEFFSEGKYLCELQQKKRSWDQTLINDIINKLELEGSVSL